MPSLFRSTLLLILGSLFLLERIQAEGIQISTKNPLHNCVEGINTALTQVTFGDKSTDPDVSYYLALCNSTWHTTSLALSSMKYCSQKQKVLDEGYKRIHGYCEEYGDFELPSWEEILAKVNQSNVLEDINTADPEIAGTMFNSSIILSQEAFEAGVRTENAWTTEQNYHHGFGWGLYILVGVVLLVGTLNRIFAIYAQKYALPYNASEELGAPSSKGLSGKWYTLYRKHIEVPALFGYKHSQASAWGFLSIPTRIQGISIFIYVALNVIFTVTGYEIFYNNLYWYGQRDTQIIRYLSDRTGIMCFYNLPLLWCLAGRNDVILWMTGWSYSTLNLFHRWVARIAILQAIVHSAGYTWLEKGYVAEEMKERYWWTGVIATIVMSLLVPFSIRPFREKFYEAFLIIHIGLALVTLVTCWYHVEIWEGQYDPWIWASTAVWGLDRFIRFIRVLVLSYKALSKKGLNTIATIPSYKAIVISSEAETDNDESGLEKSRGWKLRSSSEAKSGKKIKNDNSNGLIRLSIQTSIKIKPEPGQYYFIYTPFSLKPWENHPFTLASWTINEKDTTTLDFLVAPLKGATKRWQKKILKNVNNNNNKKLETRLLIEGPYGHTNPIQIYEKILFISGGSGITSTLPYLFKLKNLSLLQIPEPIIKQIDLVWIIKNKNYALDVLQHELKEYIELGNCGNIKIKIHLYLTRGENSIEDDSDNNNNNKTTEIDSSTPHDIVDALTYDDNNANASSSSNQNTPDSQSTAVMAEEKIQIIDNEKTSNSSSSDLSTSLPGTKSSSSLQKNGDDKYLIIHLGKPLIKDLINESVNNLIGGEKLAVSACGPHSLMDDTRSSICNIYGTGGGQVQGNRIEYFEELFAW